MRNIRMQICNVHHYNKLHFLVFIRVVKKFGLLCTEYAERSNKCRRHVNLWHGIVVSSTTGRRSRVYRISNNRWCDQLAFSFRDRRRGKRGVVIGGELANSEGAELQTVSSWEHRRCRQCTFSRLSHGTPLYDF